MNRLVFVTDVHLTEGLESEVRFARDLEEIRRLEPRPDLLVFGGDVCLWSEEASGVFLELLGGFPIPLVHVMGNHDTTLDVPGEECRRDFEELLGPANSYRRLGEAHVIGLNSCAMDPAYLYSRDWHNVLGWVPDGDLEWLEKTLAGIEDREAPLFLFVHIPFFSTYPDRLDAGQPERDVWLVGNREGVVELLKPFPNCTVGQGHLHENEHLYVEGIHFVSVGAIAGAWWSRQGFAECPDGSPRGYLVADIEGREVELTYRGVGCSPEYRACIFQKESRWYLNIFFGDAGEPVLLKIDDGWLPLRRSEGLVMRERWTSAHLWEMPEETTEREVTIRTALRGRELLIERVPFIEDYMQNEADRAI